MNLIQHAPDVRVFATRSQDMIAFPRIAPLQDLDRNTPNAPIIHFRRRWAIEVDGVPSGQSPAVIVDLIEATGGEDQENGAGWPAGPVGGSTADRAGVQSSASGTGIPVRPMIALRMGVSGSSDYHKLAAWQRILIFWKGAPGTTNEQDRQSRACYQANHSKLHAR